MKTPLSNNPLLDFDYNNVLAKLNARYGSPGLLIEHLLESHPNHRVEILTRLMRDLSIALAAYPPKVKRNVNDSHIDDHNLQREHFLRAVNYLSSLPRVIKSENNSDKSSQQINIDDEHRAITEQILGPSLKPIMLESDYSRLQDYVFEILRYNRLPETITPFPRLPISTDDLTGIFYDIHHRIHGTRSPYRDTFLGFLPKAFTQLGNVSPSTLYIKFSTGSKIPKHHRRKSNGKNRK